jgi:transposase
MARSRNGQAVPEHLRTAEAKEKLVAFQAEARSANDMKMWLRGKTLLDYIGGKRVAEIAHDLEIGESSVWNWIVWYRREGIEGLRTAKPGGSVSPLSAEQRKELYDLVAAGPLAAGFPSGIWTGVMVAELIKSRFGVTYHPPGVTRLLHQIGFSVQRPRKRLSRADPAAQETWEKERFPEIKKKPRKAME